MVDIEIVHIAMENKHVQKVNHRTKWARFILHT